MNQLSSAIDQGHIESEGNRERPHEKQLSVVLRAQSKHQVTTGKKADGNFGEKKKGRKFEICETGLIRLFLLFFSQFFYNFFHLMSV